MNRRFRRVRRHHFRKNRDRALQGGFVPSVSEADWRSLESALTQLESAVQAFRQRYETARSLQAAHAQITEQLAEAETQPEVSPTDLAHLQQQLAQLEGQLDGLLFDWRSLLDPFWQAVRFGGLGILLGWLLHRLTQ